MRSGIFVSGIASDIKVSEDTVQFTLTGSGNFQYRVTVPGRILSHIPEEGSRMTVEGELSSLSGVNYIWARRAEAKSADTRRERKNARIRNGRL